MKLIRRMENNDVFDNFFGSFGYPWLQTNKNQHILKTDIIDEGDGYKMVIDVPGFKKDEIEVILDEGYLVVNTEKTTADHEKNFLHHERMYESCTRSYYVGNIKEDDIKAKIENGTLELRFPKSNSEQEKSKAIKIN